MNDDIDRVLISELEIANGLEAVARHVTEHYRGRPFSVISVLKGSCVFAADLIRRIPIPLELAFVAAESYGSGTVAGELDIVFFPHEKEIEGREILLVDDILDTGRTLSRLVSEVRSRGARDVKTCVFLDKPARRAVSFAANFKCFEVEDTFVVGYGLDFDGKYRNLPYVGALKREAYARASV